MKHNIQTLRQNLTQEELDKFEKELRTFLTDYENMVEANVEVSRWKRAAHIIKEILGEDSS